MAPDTTHKKNNVLDKFDKILFKHLERLIGSNCGIGGLPMNSLTISCLILLMERENEIESFPSDPSVRYTAETLISELRGLGFSPEHDMNIVVQDMIEKGYINVGDNDQFIPEKPATSMAKLLDRTFPGMPGMNLVGYFIQTMDEVSSERKDLDSAISQYDQTLDMQGVPLKKGKLGSETSKVSARPEEREVQIEKPDILGRQKDDGWLNKIRVSPSGPKILSSAAYEGKLRKIDFGKPFPEKNKTDTITPHADEIIEGGEQVTRVKPEETEPHDAEPESSDKKLVTSSIKLKDADVDEKSPSGSATITKESIDDSIFSVEASLHDPVPTDHAKSSLDKTEDGSSRVAPTENHNKKVKEAIEDETDAGSEKKESQCVDDDIRKRISAFEEDLAMECPICRHSKVQIEKTAMGKSYYKCSNKNCNFISWGKPYHILCPQCKNPFLIEASKAGKTNLKCPRATCRYWKKALGDITDNQQNTIDASSEKTNKLTSITRKPRRRVVRRRVARRKK